MWDNIKNSPSCSFQLFVLSLAAFQLFAVLFNFSFCGSVTWLGSPQQPRKLLCPEAKPASGGTYTRLQSLEGHGPWTVLMHQGYWYTRDTRERHWYTGDTNAPRKEVHLGLGPGPLQYTVTLGTLLHQGFKPGIQTRNSNQGFKQGTLMPEEHSYTKDLDQQ